MSITDFLTHNDIIVNPEHLDLWVMVSAAAFNVPLRAIKIMSLTCKKYYQYTAPRLLMCKQLREKYAPLIAKALCRNYLRNQPQHKFTDVRHRMIRFDPSVSKMSALKVCPPDRVFHDKQRSDHNICALSSLWLLVNEPLAFVVNVRIGEWEWSTRVTPDKYFDTGKLIGNEHEIIGANDGRIPGRRAVKLWLPLNHYPIVCQAHRACRIIHVQIKALFTAPDGYIAILASEITHIVAFTKAVSSNKPIPHFNYTRTPLTKYLH